MLLKSILALFLPFIAPLYAVEEGAAATVGTGSTETGGGDEGGSLRSALEANWDKGETEGDKPAGTETAKPESKSSPVSEAARTLAAQRAGKTAEGTATDKNAATSAADPAKRAAELAAMTPEARAAAEAEDRAKAEAAATEAPQHWPARDRELFAKQPPEVKTWILGRHKAMEADYTRRVQEVAHVRREADELREIFKPFAEAMAADGMTIPMAVRQLAAAHHSLIKDPAQGIQWLAGKYGIDLKQIVEGGTQAGQPDPYVKKLEERLAQLEGGINTQRSAQAQQEQQANLSRVEQFAQEKDAQGNLLHPHFDELAQDIVALMKGGVAKDLQDAYDRAKYANPSIRQKVLAATDAERRAKEEDERKAKANAARTAGFDVRGEGAATSVAATTNSLRADLEASWDRAEGRV